MQVGGGGKGKLLREINCVESACIRSVVAAMNVISPAGDRACDHNGTKASYHCSNSESRVGGGVIFVCAAYHFLNSLGMNACGLNAVSSLEFTLDSALHFMCSR